MSVLAGNLYTTGTTYFVDDVVNFIQDSQKVASTILNPPRTTSTHYCVGRYSRYPSYASYWNTGPSFTYMPISVGSSTTVIHNHGTLAGRGQRRSADEPSDGTRVLVGLASMVIGGYALYKTGESLTHLQEAKQEKADIGKIEREVFLGERTSTDPNVTLLRKVVDARNRISDRINKNAVWNLALLVGTVSAAIFAMLGALVASSPLMLTGVAVGLVVGGVALFKAGYYSDKKEKADAQALQNALGQFKAENFPLPATSTKT